MFVRVRTRRGYFLLILVVFDPWEPSLRAVYLAEGRVFWGGSRLFCLGRAEEIQAVCYFGSSEVMLSFVRTLGNRRESTVDKHDGRSVLLVMRKTIRLSWNPGDD